MSNHEACTAQIPFAFARNPQIYFNSFLPGENEQVVKLLKKVASKEVVHHVFLFGAKGTGKSHLLQAICKLASESGIQVAYIPLSEHQQISPMILHDLADMDLVCVDDIEMIAGIMEWEQSLTWLYNELRDNQHSMIISSALSAATIKFQLEDLRSRLNWDQVLRLVPVSDELKIQILKQNARQRAFELSDEVIEYMIRRVERDLGSLMKIVDEIDHASLVAKRKITIPFIKTLIS